MNLLSVGIGADAGRAGLGRACLTPQTIAGVCENEAIDVQNWNNNKLIIVQKVGQCWIREQLIGDPGRERNSHPFT